MFPISIDIYVLYGHSVRNTGVANRAKLKA